MGTEPRIHITQVLLLFPNPGQVSISSPKRQCNVVTGFTNRLHANSKASRFLHVSYFIMGFTDKVKTGNDFRTGFVENEDSQIK